MKIVRGFRMTTDEIARKAKEEAISTGFDAILSKEDPFEGYSSEREDIKDAFEVVVSIAQKPLIEDNNKKDEEIERLNNSLNEKYPLSSAIRSSVENTMKEMRERIAELEKENKELISLIDEIVNYYPADSRTCVIVAKRKLNSMRKSDENHSSTELVLRADKSSDRNKDMRD